MTIKRENTARKTAVGYQKLIAGLIIVGAISYSLFSYRGLFVRAFACGAGSGRLAKFEFCLSEGIRFAVNSVAWSPNGRYIATGSAYSREIHVWDVRRRRIISKLQIPYPPEFFHELAWSPNGKYLAACDGTGVLRIYNTETWKLAHIFTELGQLAGCNHPAFSSDSTRVAVIGTRLVVYSLPDWRMLESVSLREGWAKADSFNTVTYVPNAYTVIVGGGQYIRDLKDGEKESWDGRVWLFCEEGDSPCRTVTVYRPASGHAGGGPVWNLAVSPDGQFVVTGTNTGTLGPGDTPIEPVHVVRLSDGVTVGAPLDNMRPFGRADGLEYTTDGRYIVAGHDQADGAVHIISARSFKVLDFFHADGFVDDIAVNPRGDEFAVAAGDKVVVWSLTQR